MLSDTAVFVRVILPDGYIWNDSLYACQKTEGIGKPMYCFNYEKETCIHFENDDENKYIKDIASLIIIENIDKIEVIEDEGIRAIYGKNAAYGLIRINLNSKKVYKTIEKLKLHSAQHGI